MGVKRYDAITISQLNRNPSKYITMVENSNLIIYVIKNSIIVAKIEKVDFGGEINKTSNLEGALIA